MIMDEVFDKSPVLLVEGRIEEAVGEKDVLSMGFRGSAMLSVWGMLGC